MSILISLLIAVLVFVVVWFLVDKLLALLSAPAPMVQIVQIILVCIALIYALQLLFGWGWVGPLYRR